MRPGVEITSKAARAARGEPTATGPWFVTGLSEKGLVDEATHVRSLDEFVRHFGDRVAYGQLYDALDVFFSEGGADAYVSRVVGAAAAKAEVTFNDGAAAPALTIEALSEGEWANGAAEGLSAEIDNVAGGTFDVVIYLDGNEVERFAALADTTAAVAALASSDYVRGVDPGAVGDPAAAGPTNLAGGADDRASIVEADWTAALALFGKDLGPGQVSAPGRTTADAHTALITHARNNNRTAYLDTADGASKATMLAAAAAQEDVVGAEYAGIFGGWVKVPGLTSGTTRSVPPSAFAAGLTARLDAAAGTSGRAPAGDQGAANYALDVTTPAGGLTDDDYEDLNDANVNMIRAFRNRGVQLYGFRSVTSDDDWRQLTSTRLRVSLTARLEAIALGYVFRTVDAKGQLLGEFNGSLAGECMNDYRAGALFGDDPEDAFRVDTSDAINTEETLADGEIRAGVYARFSPFAELVRIDIVKVPVTGRV